MADNELNPIQLPCPAGQFVPHEPPMLLIDKLLSRDGKMTTASAIIESDSIYKDPQHGILPEYFIEIIAQTMAAANGFDAYLNLAPVKNGFITEVSSFSLCENKVNYLEFVITVEEVMALGSMKLMKGEVFAASISLAVAELKIYEDDS
ncbi:MAG: hypothetical protein QNJ17_06240 [Desulfocapsaceae bacterium]|nr:hypothetical protein [Desulfocapsaceae bacterium]